MRALLVAIVALLAAAAVAAAAPPRIESAVGTSRSSVRVTFREAAQEPLGPADFGLSMGNEVRALSNVAVAADGLSAVLTSSTSWPYGTAGSVTLGGRPPVRVWASPGDVTPPSLTNVRITKHVLCSVSVSAGCAQSGATVSFLVDEAVLVVLDLRKKGSSAPSTQKYPRPAGPGRVTFREKIEGLRLRPGAYVLTVSALDAAGNESRRYSFRLRVRS